MNGQPGGTPVDPAEEVSFAGLIARSATSLDPRTDIELAAAGSNDPDPMRRELALFELLSRQDSDAFPALANAFRSEEESMVRQNLLWAIQKTRAADSVSFIRDAVNDEDPNVSEWASIFFEEMSNAGANVTFETIRKPGRSIPDHLFDETLFLHITCDVYVRLDDRATSWGKLRLSPLALARLFGQAYACPMVATRENQIVIAKVLEGLVPERNYYEMFLFRGITERSEPTVGNFYFESSGPRVFFPSGRAEDFSEGAIRDVNVTFARDGSWFLDPHLPLAGDLAIRYVRGGFMGWAYVNLDRIMSDDPPNPIQPGNAILSTLHHPDAGPLTNAVLAGNFKGRLRDVDGDGVLEFNPFEIPSTLGGELDSNFDGIADGPGITQSSAAFL